MVHVVLPIAASQGVPSGGECHFPEFFCRWPTFVHGEPAIHRAGVVRSVPVHRAVRQASPRGGARHPPPPPPRALLEGEGVPSG